MEIIDIKRSKIDGADEEQLIRLIKQAGEDARAKKKKLMELHFKKVKKVVAEGVACRQRAELSTTTSLP